MRNLITNKLNIGKKVFSYTFIASKEFHSAIYPKKILYINYISKSNLKYSSILSNSKNLSTIFEKKFYSSSYGDQEPEKIIWENGNEIINSSDTDKSLGSTLDLQLNREDNDLLSSIPPAPEPKIEILDTVPLDELGEPLFHSLGLGGYWPIGLIQSTLETIHISGNLSWWATIITATVILRLCIIPLVIKMQRDSARMSHLMPEFMNMNEKMKEQQMKGNVMEASRIAHEMAVFQEENKFSLFTMIRMPLIQGPIFISMFCGLRGCINLPVESFKTGGLYWFTDLTVTDPYFILPILLSSTLYITIKSGAETGAPINELHAKMMKYMAFGMPLLMLPFSLQFPSGILFYWLSNNIFSMVQVHVFRNKKVKQYFNIPEVKPFAASIKTNPLAIDDDDRGFMEKLRDARKTVQMAAEYEERKQFKKLAEEKKSKLPKEEFKKYLVGKENQNKSKD